MAERRAIVNVSGSLSELPTTDILPGVQTFHGFVFPYEVSLSYDKTARTVTITPSGATFSVWVGGIRYVKTGAQTSIAHTNASGDYYLYYGTDGELAWSADPWDMKVVSPVCYVYYDTIPADGIALFELHTYKRNPEWHESQHFAIGTFVRSGLEISGYTLNGDGNAAVTFQVASGTIVDEDIEFAISTLADNGPYTIIRRSGTGYTWDSANNVPYLSGATWIQYNQNVTGNWQMTEAGNQNRWINYFLYAATALETTKRLFLIPGQTLHTTLSAAQSESNSSLDLAGLSLPEVVCVWKLTYLTGSSYTATGRARLVEVNRITNTRGALSVSLTSTTHNLLTGRDVADTHPASSITNTPAGNIAATTVQAAINELDSEKQPLDGDLTAIAALAGTSGFLKKTAENTWSLDTSMHLVSTDIGVSVQAYDADISTVSASQAEMEAGAETALRSMSPLRVKQAIVKQAQAIPDLTIASVSTTLHRSPNAITAMFVYDTSKDSDGGAWTEKCQHTSWYNETIYGRWLGAQSTWGAAAALATSATDHFQLTTDGKFYKARANLLTYTEQFDNAIWTKSGCTIGQNTAGTTDPLGGNTADKIIENAGTITPICYCTSTPSSTGSPVRFSCYLKQAERRYAQLAATSNYGTANTISVDLQTGSIVASGVSVLSSSISDAGNGWWFVSMTVQSTASPYGGFFRISPQSTSSASASFSYTGDGTSGIYAWGADLRVESTAALFPAYQSVVTGSEYEVFRGNKRSFPKVAAIVAEAANVTIYDLTEVGRPMFARYVNTGAMATGNIAALHAISGQVFVGGASGLARLNFATDRLWVRTTSALSSQAALATIRTAARTTEVGTAFTNAAIADVKATVLPDAPVDPATGLKIPTVVVATGARVVVIHNSGTLVNSSSTSAFTQVTLTPQLLSAGRADAVWYYAASPGSLGASFTLSTKNASTATDFNVGNTTLLRSKDRANYARTSGADIQILRNNEGTIGKGLAAKISDTYNAGWMVGDIRRAYLSDIGAGGVAATELVTNGDFSNGTTEWIGIGVGWSISGGVATIDGSNAATSYLLHSAVSGVAVGEKYRISYDYTVTAGRVRINSTAFGLTTNIGIGTGTSTAVITAAAGSTQFSVQAIDAGTIATIDNVSIKPLVSDRSYKSASTTITGTLTKTAVASNAQLVAYSGFSAANYLQEPYSADLDFGTGEWSVSAWVNVPTSLPTENFPVISSELITDPSFDNPANWTTATGWSVTGGQGVATSVASGDSITPNVGGIVGKTYLVSFQLISCSGGAVGFTYGSGSQSTPGTYTQIIVAPTTSNAFSIRAYGATTAVIDNVSVKEVGASLIADRAYSSGPYIRLGVIGNGSLTATAYDGTTTRTVTTTTAYNTATWTKARVNYTTDGKLALLVNGVEAVSTTGTALLTLNNSNAVLTIGNSYALDAPFPGSLALLKFSATVPTTEQAVFAYEQEKQLFREGAQCILPASTSVLDLAYDDATDTWSALQATYESTWSGLVRTSAQAPSAGSFSKAAASSGVKLLGRTTTNPGVDVQIPSKNLRPKDMPRDINQDITVFDFDAVTSQTDFTLPVGYTARVVYSTGAQKREGSTKDWTRLYDGFKETIRFGAAPGNGVWVQVHAVKEVA